jgi:hypothetical protein
VPSLNKISIPIIRNVSPISIADICSAQDMTEDSNENALRISTEPEQPMHGARRHSFLEGWQHYYHGEWISTDTWWKLKIAGV